ncbi:MAG: type II toxin-antitoxin system RelE/ParE family toxin [Candidatus Beckwithbacteria bacterium]|nr:type II toxin-antitoxin system RelE/ParE family toxin [Candidatus Beckwithbacteria bacterium]
MPWRAILLVKVYKDLVKLSIKDRSRIESAIGFLEKYGPFIKPPLCKKIKANLFELRIRGQDSYRIFYTFVKGNYYLVHLFKKKSQKIPPREIKVALDRVKQII